MTRDVSPILDRHTQEQLGRMLRRRLTDARLASPSQEIESLLASLRSADACRERTGTRGS